MTDRVTAAARALCTLASKECGIDDKLNWIHYSRMFLKDAAAALKAADAISKAEADAVLTAKVAELETIVKIYRETYGVRGVKV